MRFDHTGGIASRALLAALVLALAGCEDRVAPDGDSCLLDLSGFHEFEFTVLPGQLCVEPGEVRVARVQRQDRGRYAVEFGIARQRYCRWGDILDLESIPARSLSDAEVDLVMDTFARIPVERALPATCLGCEPDLNCIARWDKLYLGRVCTADHLEAPAVHRLLDLVRTLCGELASGASRDHG
jgi:hypothetical protein